MTRPAERRVELVEVSTPPRDHGAPDGSQLMKTRAPSAPLRTSFYARLMASMGPQSLRAI